MIQLIEDVPCSDKVHHTAFGFFVDEQQPGELLVGFVPLSNFRLVDPARGTKFTDAVMEKLNQIYPRHRVIFGID